MKLIAFLLLVPAIAAYSISQIVQHGKLRWSKSYNGFWGEDSSNRKYKKDWRKDPLGYDMFPAPNTWYYRFFKIKYREAFPLSATFLTNFTDGYHMCQSIMFLCLAGSFSIAMSLNFFLVWSGILLVHFVTYRALQK